MNNSVKKGKNYLSTQVKAIIVFVVMIVVFVPLWFFVLKPEETPTQTNKQPSVDYSLYDHAVYIGTNETVKEIASDNVESIHMTKDGTTWGFVYDYTDETFYLDGYGKKIAYDTMSFGYINYFCYSGSALKLIAEDVKDLGRYGLASDSENLLTLHVKTRDGKEVEVLVGDQMVDTSGYYATTAGNDKVYSINSMTYGYISCSEYDIMSLRITNPFTESEYTPNSFVIYHGSEKFVELKSFDVNEATDMEYVKTTQVIYPTAYIPFSASNAYSNMTYTYLRSVINGERVVAAEKENETFDEAYLKETFGIDANDPNCMRLVYNHEFEDVGLIENDVLFSAKDKDGYYYAYNLALGTVVKIKASSIPFMEWDAEQYMEPAVYLQSINTVKELIINSTGLQDYYVKDGHHSLNEKFVSNAPLEADSATLEVKRGDGSALPQVYKDGALYRTGLDNYCYLFLALQSIDIHEKMNEDDIKDKNIDLNAPGVTVTIVTRSGSEHVLRFYYYGSSGAYFTYNGEGGYSVPQSSIKKMLTACYNVCNGILVA